MYKSIITKFIQLEPIYGIEPGQAQYNDVLNVINDPASSQVDIENAIGNFIKIANVSARDQMRNGSLAGTLRYNATSDWKDRPIVAS